MYWPVDNFKSRSAGPGYRFTVGDLNLLAFHFFINGFSGGRNERAGWMKTMIPHSISLPKCALSQSIF